MKLAAWALMLLPAAAPAAAEVKSSAAGGFEVQSKALVAASPADAYAALVKIGDWWDPAHSYSGKPANLTLNARVGGCFCEKLDGGGTVEHLRVVQARPGVLLRLQGGLGPLQAQAVVGTMSWTFKASERGTEISQTYVVGGYVSGGAEKLAPLVDKMLADQLARLQQRLSAPR